jgi:thymidylate kinase
VSDASNEAPPEPPPSNSVPPADHLGRVGGREVAHPETPRTTVAAAFELFLARLTGDGIPYLLLRGALNFPHHAPGSDVDLLVRPQDSRFVELVLDEIGRRMNCAVYARHRAGFLTQLYMHGRSEDGDHSFLTVDLHTSEACFGIPFMEADELLPGYTDERGLQVPTDWLGALVNFLGPWLSGGVIKTHYLDALSEVMVMHDADVRARCRRWFGRTRGDGIANAMHARDTETLCLMSRRSRIALMWRALMHKPARRSFAMMRFAWGTRIRPLWKPRGMTLAVIGTDGAGKTTLLNAMREVLDPAFRASENTTFKLRAAALPTLDQLMHFGRRTHTLEDFNRPHRAAPSGPFGSMLRAAWYALDSRLGWWIRVTPRRRRHCLVLFDRYFDDFLVDPLRARIRANAWTTRFFSKFVPRPDHVMVCTAPLEVVRARKQEISEAQTDQQLRSYELLAKQRPEAFVINTDCDLDVAVDRALSELYPLAAAPRSKPK